MTLLKVKKIQSFISTVEWIIHSNRSEIMKLALINIWYSYHLSYK